MKAGQENTSGTMVQKMLILPYFSLNSKSISDTRLSCFGILGIKH